MAQDSLVRRMPIPSTHDRKVVRDMPNLKGTCTSYMLYIHFMVMHNDSSISLLCVYSMEASQRSLQSADDLCNGTIWWWLSDSVGMHLLRLQDEPYNHTYPVSILRKSISGRYRPVRVADGPMTARCRFT